jgi:hypothetical protein
MVLKRGAGPHAVAASFGHVIHEPWTAADEDVALVGFDVRTDAA